jgi:hypothetical protein
MSSRSLVHACRSVFLLPLLLACWIASPARAGQADNEQITGSGGKLLRYSSSQVIVDLSEQERADLNRLRDQVFQQSSAAAVLAAAAAALKALGYGTVAVDPDFHLVEGQHDQALVSKGREILRGILKSKMGLPGKPDHKSTQALIAVRPLAADAGVKVRVRFRSTTWDSNGDSRTKTDTDAATYEEFFSGLKKALQSSP